MKIAILGRETNLALAELETQAKDLNQHGAWACTFEHHSTEVDVNEFGSIVKIGDVLAGSLSPKDTELITDTIVKSLAGFGERKVSFGLSIYGVSDFIRQIDRKLALSIKKKLQKNVNVPVRYIAPKASSQLNSAQVIHNNLASRGGDFLLVQSNNRLIVARTTSVQDIESFAHRDYDRPCRSAKVGMLPPKLAKTMVNLAHVASSVDIVDPFCGSGTVLQEALLMGHNSYGGDNSPQMITCSQNNLSWLVQEYQLKSSYELSLQDAAKFSPNSSIKDYAIVTEGYLGQPLSQKPSTDKLNRLEKELTELYASFLSNLHKTNPKPKAVVICLPFWETAQGLYKLKIIDQIESLGYTMSQFQSVDSTQIWYKRPDQVVGRQILILRPMQG